MEARQMGLFETTFDRFIIDKPIRLIELFAGIGAQSKALENLGADFERHRVVEWSCNSIIAYNAIHVRDFNDYSRNLTKEEVLSRVRGVSIDYNKPATDAELLRKGEKWLRKLYSSMVAIYDFCPDVSRVHADDLDITERDKYCYILTYSFPCQDLSTAGNGKGMSKGSGTRSGLLWEVERILKELKASDQLPHVLVMENVPQVCSMKNSMDWESWLQSLEKLGYTNYFDILNSKDYGIPQNRNRCFCVSILGRYGYSFPIRIPLSYCLRDFLDVVPDEKYYLKDSFLKKYVPNYYKYFVPISKGRIIKAGSLNYYGFNSENVVLSPKGISTTILARDCYGPKKILLDETICLNSKVNGKQPSLSYRVYSDYGVSTACTTSLFFMGSVMTNLKIRKLTPYECGKLMGFDRLDFERMSRAGLPEWVLYHSAGDSIVTTVLMGIFGELLGSDYETAIKGVSLRISEEII